MGNELSGPVDVDVPTAASVEQLSPGKDAATVGKRHVHIAHDPPRPAASTKRPGGSGVIVSPSKGKQQTSPRLTPLDGTPGRTREGRNPRRSLQDLTPVSPGQLRTAISVPEPPISLETRRSQDLKQELVRKIQSLVRNTSQTLRSPSRHDHHGPSVSLTPEKHEAPLTQRTSWVAKLLKSKEETMQALDHQQQHPFSEPLTHEQVGKGVEQSLGDDLPTFTAYQGAIHGALQSGLRDDLVDEFFLDEEAEQQLTTYEKWAAIRQAAEQMLQVYTNRSNSSWIEAEQWQPPAVMDASVAAQSAYSSAVDRALTRGEVALLFIDDGRLAQYSPSPSDIAPLVTSDLWQAVKELSPLQVPCTHRLEQLSTAGRHLLQAAVSVETWYGAAALRRMRAVAAVDCAQELQFVGELQKWGFFGFTPDNLAVLPLPRFHGFAEDQRAGRLAHVKNSAKLMLGTGYAVFLLNSPAEAYTLTPEGEPRCLSGSVLSWLDESNISWVCSGLFSDLQRLRPDAMLDADFLAAAMYTSDRAGCQMAMEVVPGTSERDVRTYDSIVLRRAASVGAAGGHCNLRASAMRTVRSYQIIQQAVASAPGSVYVGTQRYAFRVPALQQLLSDASNFRMDVVLHDFYAYANLDLADITSSRMANCACIVSSRLPGPPMVDVVLGKAWLKDTAAPILQLQDKASEFRRKALDLLRVEHTPFPTPGRQSLTFKERRSGTTVVLLLTLEHSRLATVGLRMARLFVRNIVDRLHMVVLVGPGENKAAAKGLLDELGDKELDFQGQLVREVVVREANPAAPKDLTCMRNYCVAANASLVVVPSVRLSTPTATIDLGGDATSLAIQLLRDIPHLPVLLVKAVNHVGRLSSSRASSYAGGLTATSSTALQGARPGLVVMCHLDTSQVFSQIQAITPFLLPAVDLLYLARTHAFERPGQLSMRSRRMFVQARMAVAGPLRVEERAYAAAAASELPKAVDAEGVDMLVVTAASALPPSKDMEDILRIAKCCVYVHRSAEQAPGAAAMNNLMASP